VSASFRIVLRGAQSDAGDAVAAIGRFAAGAGLPAALQNDLAVIVDEVVSNWLGHGGAAGVPTSEMQIEFSLDADRLRLRFSDNAPPFDPLAAAPPDFSIPPDRRPIGGLGLHLLRALTDSQRYARVDGRNLLELERSIPGELG
jgi:anti-sigma regulatory factor (Ser/Thr protein kinase)